MRRLHIIASVDPRGGGPIEGLIQQSLNDPQLGSADVDIVSLDRPTDPHVIACPVTVIALGASHSSSSLRGRLPWARYGFSSKLPRWLKSNLHSYDVVIVHGLWNFSVMAARMALVRSGTPYVVFAHGMLDPWFKRTYKVKALFKQVSWWLCEGPLLNNANAVLFTTEDEKLLARNAFWPYRVKERVVGFGTSDAPAQTDAQHAHFRRMVPALGDKRYLLFLSRIHPKKGCDLLIDAFASIANEHPTLDLVIAGPDQISLRHTLEAQASRLGVANRVHWPGMLTGDAKWGAFYGAEAFVLTSHQENFGVVVAEAMAAGRPVLISDKVNIWREVVASGAGLAEADTPEGSRKLLRRFFSMSESDRGRMGAAARSTFLARYDIKGCVDTINATLRDLEA